MDSHQAHIIEYSGTVELQILIRINVFNDIALKTCTNCLILVNNIYSVTIVLVTIPSISFKLIDRSNN